MLPPADRSCWIVTDGAIGNEKQCQALAHYVGLQPQVFRIGLRQPWDLLAPHLKIGGHHALQGSIREHLGGPFPDLLIAAGRRSALAAMTIKDLSRGHTFAVQVLDPRIDPSNFDLVICPRHDQLSGPNVIKTLGALHQVDSQSLEQARAQWADLIEALPTPRYAVLIGASNRAYTIDRDYLACMADTAEGWIQAAGGSVMVTTSRRTPAALQEYARHRFGDMPGRVWSGRESADNPYPGLLAWADRIMVSADSVNMISEACGTGKPVYCSAPGSRSKKFARFHRNMRKAGLTLPLDHQGQAPEYRPLRDARDAARELIERMR